MPTPTPYQESPPATLPVPCPTQPVAGRSIETDAPSFDWTPVPDASRYHVQIASTDAFDVIYYDETTDRGAVLPLDDLLPDDATKVFWRVRAETKRKEHSPWSDPAHVMVGPVDRDDEEALRVDAPPVPIHPEGTRETPLDREAVPFSWEGIPEASGYQLQVTSTEDFEDSTVDLTLDRTTSVTLCDVLPSEATSFYWRVRCLFRVAGPGPWSDPVPFTVAPEKREEDDLAYEPPESPSTARASGPVERARTSSASSIGVALIAIISFLVTILLIALVG